MRVLLVDGDDDLRLTQGEYLRRADVEIDEATDGRLALAKAMAHPPDAVVTEMRLPGISGDELCQLLRQGAMTSATPILIVTSRAHPVDLERAQAAGADEVLVKPFPPDILLAEIRRLVDGSRILRAHAQVGDLMPSQSSRAQQLQARLGQSRVKPLSKAFVRHSTTTPPHRPPALVCPTCLQSLTYARSHIGGVSERNREQWDYYECSAGCGEFQYRQRTRKLRQVS